ncbi:MAG TPA: hypothetical protein PLZ99_02865 [Parcubacteria group bacterium]|jgi:hypothetical protein|nr:hypothetical protein [Parcubacteria group bacterium]
MDRISWETVEYLHTEKTSDWYWIVGIITLSAALIAIILNNVIFAILIIVSSFTLSIFASRRPDMVTATIDKSGVTFGRTRHAYSNIESFWIETRDSYPRLLLKSNKVFMPFIVLHIHEDDADEIKNVLSKYLPEEENTEPLLEKVLIYLGF